MVFGKIQRKRIAIALAALLLTMTQLASCGRIRGSNVVLAGSTSVQPYIEVLAEEFDLIHPEIDVDIQGGGSSAGITAAEAGTADLGMSSRSLTDREQGFWVIEIAKDGLAIIVNPQNPITDLSLSRICAIYAGEITNWSDIGGLNARIHVITREEGSGTRTAFEDLVMSDRVITPRAIVQDSNGAVRQLISSDPNSIGFISLGLVNDTVRAIKIGGVPATRENVINGSYGLFRPFLFVSRDEPEGYVKVFVDFVLSAEGRRILIDEGLIT